MRLAVDVVDAAVAEPQVVTDLVHEGPRLFEGGPHATGVAGDQGIRWRPAAQGDQEVVAEHLGAAGGRVDRRGRRRGLVVDEEPVVEGEALCVEPARVRALARGAESS